MPRISWDLWKISFPLKCMECGHLHNMFRDNCENCGKTNTLIKTTKKDYKNANK